MKNYVIGKEDLLMDKNEIKQIGEEVSPMELEFGDEITIEDTVCRFIMHEINKNGLMFVVFHEESNTMTTYLYGYVINQTAAGLHQREIKPPVIRRRDKIL